LKKISHISSSNFSPFPRGLKEIKTIYDSRKYRVEVISFDREHRFPLVEYVDNVKIIRKRPSYWFKGNARVFNVLIFCLSLFPESVRQGADILHCSGYLSLLIGVPLKMITGKKLVYDAYEDWIYQVGRRHTILPKLVYVIEKKLVEFADYILTVDSVDEELYKRFKGWNENVQILENAPIIQDFDAKANRKPRFDLDSERDIVFYVGGISEDKGLFKMLEAINEVKKSNPKAKLVIAGGLSERIKQSANKYIEDKELSEDVDFLGYVDYRDVPSLLKSSTIGLILYQPTSWHLRSKASSKLFLYMAAAIPIIVSDFPGFREIISGANCGLLIDPSDVKEISKSITALLTDKKRAQELGENGRKAILERYNWELEGLKLMKVYEGLSK